MVVKRVVICSVLILLSMGVSLAEATEVAALEANPVTIPAKYDGLIRRPRVCPVDSVLVAFEVANEASVRLHIYNTATSREIELQPPVHAYGPVESLIVARNDYLDWLPVSNAGGIWAAFVSDVTGTSELYLYEVRTNRYYQIMNRDDSTRDGEKIDVAWSPDGRVLAYSSNEHGNFGIYVLRGMDRFLRDPTNINNLPAHELRVYGQGDVRAPVWVPCEGCGYLAYTSLEKETERSRIHVADLKSIGNASIASGTIDTRTGVGYFAPAWSPDGRRLAFFQNSVGTDEWKRSSDSTGEQYALAVYRVEREPGREELRLVRELDGNHGNSDEVLEVARNNTPFQPPVWLPDGKGLVVSVYQQDSSAKINPCKVVDLTNWTEGATDSQWLKGLGNATDKFDAPLDASITGRRLSFTCQQGEDRVLVVGALEPQESYGQPLDPLPCKDRLGWWNRWSKGRDDHSVFVKMAQALVNPVWGPKYLMVNRPIVPLAGIAIFLLARKSPTAPVPHDWTIPDLPSGSVAQGFHISVGF